MQIEELIENFGVLDDWEDRYKYLIDLGRALEPLHDTERTPETKVRGCASQVWLVTDRRTPEGPMHFRGDSDAHIVRGLIAVLLAIYSGHTPQEIQAIDERKFFAELGLNDHLTPQRSNGLASMVARIKAEAAASLGQTPATTA